MNRHAIGYQGPDELAHVAVFAPSENDAQQIAILLNRDGFTGKRGQSIAGSFSVAHIPGRVPAVLGKLTGN